MNSDKTLPIMVADSLNDSDRMALHRRTSAIFKKLNIPAEEADFIEERILEHYCLPHRAYHNLSHLLSLFRVVESTDLPIKNPTVFHLAILFHDIIYDPKRKDNEVKSAALANTLIGRYLEKEDKVMLSLMIESTVGHRALINDDDLKLFLDCDLSVLAAPPLVYKQYAKAIRREFIHFPYLLYRQGRKKVLKYFLKKERLYITDYFHENFEQQAKANLRTELQRLKSLFS